jgi:hypothetical protein
MIFEIIFAAMVFSIISLAIGKTCFECYRSLDTTSKSVAIVAFIVGELLMVAATIDFLIKSA